MKWLIGIVVLVLLVVSVRFRKFVLGLVAVGAAVGGVVYLINEHEESRSLSRIPVSQLTFENVMLTPDYSGYKISGRVKNTSAQFTLTLHKFRLAEDLRRLAVRRGNATTPLGPPYWRTC
jgi:hypothetical protein